MKSRYFIVVLVPGEMPVENAHMSLVPPVYLGEDKTEEELVKRIDEIKFLPFTASFSDLGIFEQKGRKMLYAKVEPKEEIQKLHEMVMEKLGDMVEIDTTPFTDGVIPSFEPHVTLDYNFEETVSGAPKMSFVVEKIWVIREGFNGEWQVVNK